jgi:outer membrane protein TolC
MVSLSSVAARCTFAACLFSASLHCLASTEPRALTFDDAVMLAVERAPELTARRSLILAASEEVARADALPDPMLMAGIQNLPIAGDDAYTLGRDRMTMRRLGLSQAFPSRAKRNARRLAAETAVDQAQAEAIADELSIRRSAAKAWITLWAAQRELEMLRALEEQTALAVRAAEARLSGGGGTTTDALAARSAELELANQITAAQTGIELARAALARRIGAPAEAVMTDAPDFSRAPLRKAELLAYLDQQADLLVWESREAAAEAGVALAIAEKQPDWELGGGYAQRGADASDTIWLEVKVDLPIFGRNRQDRGIAARRAELDGVQAARAAARLAQTERVEALYAAWSGLGEQTIRHQTQILPLADDRARIALAAFSSGEPLQAWIDARRDDLAARVRLARMLAEWGRAWAEIAYLLPTEIER